MNTFLPEVLAYIGAAAWLPQTLIPLYNKFNKPTIAIHADHTAQIGYTLYGPIININLALHSSKEIIIDFIGIQISRVNGQIHEFRWAGITETFSQIKSLQGENQIIQREHSPLLFRISTLSTLEYFFRFQEQKFHCDQITTSSELLKKFSTLRADNKDYPSSIIKSDEFQKYLEFMESYFWWKPGKYKIVFEIKAKSKLKLTRCSYTLNLENTHVNTLRANLGLIDLACLHFVAPGINQEPSMLWAYPALTKIND